MSFLSIFISFLLLSSTSQCHGSYEVLKMVHMYGKAYCLGKPSPACPTSTIFPRNFTIHGLWPTNITNLLNTCNGAPYPYVPESPGPFRTGMLADWPDYQRSVAETESLQLFWGHEWTDHGVCMAPQVSQREYFQAALDLKNSVDFYRELTTRGITPGPTKYPYLQLDNAVSSSISGKKADLRCSQSTCLLMEIRPCYAPASRAPVDCPATQKDLTDPKKKLLVRSASCIACKGGVRFPPI